MTLTEVTAEFIDYALRFADSEMHIVSSSVSKQAVG